MNELSVDVSGAKILVVDDVPANLDMLCQALEAAQYQVIVASSGEMALDVVGRFVPDLILLDVVMPGLDGFATCRRLKEKEPIQAIPIIFLTARDETADLVEGFHAGGVDYVVKPFQKEELLIRIQTQLEKAGLMRALSEKNDALEAEIARRQALTHERNQLANRLSLADQREAQRWGLGEFVGQSPLLQKILEDLDLLQNVPQTSVLILGESGTGKELIARVIHASGPRRDEPFVPVNCGSLPRELADSLLFGHVKGAFTGADQDQAGYFELADGGILFLDEVGTMPLELQPKLLRVLEDRTVQPLGARQSRAVDVRVVAATNADLATQTEEGRFRQDLYYRLAHFTVRVPPLRERREDIDLLARHFLQVFALEMGIEPPAVNARAQTLLEEYGFPGNVRELKNLMERALIKSRGGEIRPEHLELEQPAAASAPTSWPDLPLDLDQALELAEEEVVRRVLAQTGQNVAAAARLLGTNRPRIYRTLERLKSRLAG